MRKHVGIRREPERKVLKLAVTVQCTCGGEVSASLDGALVHTLPTCAEYDAVETADEGANYLARIRTALEARN